MYKLFELKFGSHLYGTNTENSDIDVKGIFLPTARDIVLGRYKKTVSTCRAKQEHEKNNKDDVDQEFFSLDRYLQLLAEGQTVALDILFGIKDTHPVNWYSTYIWSEIYKNKDKLLCKDLASFIGYAKTQAAKYGLKGHRVAALREVREWANLSPFKDHAKLIELDPHSFVNQLQNIHVKIFKDNKCEYLEVNNKKYQMNIKLGLFRDQINQTFENYGRRALMAERNEGIDWKALSHAVRVNSEGLELLKTGHITFPCQNRELLLKIKTGQMEYKEVADLIVQGQEELTRAALVSKLREKPDLEWIDNFVADIYTDIVKETQYVFKDWTGEKWNPEQKA